MMHFPHEAVINAWIFCKSDLASKNADLLEFKGNVGQAFINLDRNDQNKRGRCRSATPSAPRNTEEMKKLSLYRKRNRKRCTGSLAKIYGCQKCKMMLMFIQEKEKKLAEMMLNCLKYYHKITKLLVLLQPHNTFVFFFK